MKRGREPTGQPGLILDGPGAGRPLKKDQYRQVTDSGRRPSPSDTQGRKRRFSDRSEQRSLQSRDGTAGGRILSINQLKSPRHTTSICNCFS